MNKSSYQNTGSKEFNIYEKLTATNTHWCHHFSAQPHDEGFNYQFRTTCVDGVEFAVYERIDNFFVLVDFFKSYDEACDDAKKIIDEYPDIKRMFSANQLRY
ncbi:TPA: hypothetical protein QH575_004812 [Enterobacter kobei]|uniref:Uncharacterized protein n=1 Tax=Enterobacter cloacae TaxID=550 RepID=A0A6S5JNX8_ENTCL|nr:MULTISPECIES: hypothetical protein [Enterobacter cloacae complex]HDS4483889.1 hypothetical protein [Enterobacter hormaechei subsp. steigerwaltii]MCV2769433.1 hypothetical protein [Enterobacter hormaechei]MCV2797481.1 hypothetical protein [Enterobacter hormaechei]MDD9237259.1 hypothetical protein [Enterobacter kobei]SAI57765.1 Uncharacterised protein [Enterobacter hormaechei]